MGLLLPTTPVLSPTTWVTTELPANHPQGVRWQATHPAGPALPQGGMSRGGEGLQVWVGAHSAHLGAGRAGEGRAGHL